MMRRGALLCVLLAGAAARPAAGVDFSALGVDFAVSGYGTLGYANSNQPYAYQRFISDSGTLKRDSVAGLQIDAKFNSQFGVTVQGKVAAPTSSDSGYQASLSWAFLSYRPANDWLFRLGRQRIPFYLYSQTIDVGVTYDFARLPIEMYSINTSNDFNGLSFVATWDVGAGELALDGYIGKGNADLRFWKRDYIDTLLLKQTPGPEFAREDAKGGGIVLTYKRGDDLYRIGLSYFELTRPGGLPIPTEFPFVTLAPGVGFYRICDVRLPCPGLLTRNMLPTTLLTLGGKSEIGAGVRAIGEYARTYIPGIYSAASSRGYLSLLRPVDEWTPYVFYAFLRSPSGVREYYNAVNYNTVPDFVPGAPSINASQRVGADQLIAYDQSSWAVGTSYSFSATSKAKIEFMRTRIGEMSSLVDAPPGANIRNQNINVFSLSYSFAF